MTVGFQKVRLIYFHSIIRLKLRIQFQMKPSQKFGWISRRTTQIPE